MITVGPLENWERCPRPRDLPVDMGDLAPNERGGPVAAASSSSNMTSDGNSAEPRIRPPRTRLLARSLALGNLQEGSVRHYLGRIITRGRPGRLAKSFLTNRLMRTAGLSRHDDKQRRTPAPSQHSGDGTHARTPEIAEIGKSSDANRDTLGSSDRRCCHCLDIDRRCRRSVTGCEVNRCCDSERCSLPHQQRCRDR